MVHLNFKKIDSGTKIHLKVPEIDVGTWMCHGILSSKTEMD